MTTRVIRDQIPDRQHFAFDGTLAINLYDLCFYDGNSVQNTLSQTDQLTEPLNQAYFAQRFAGLAADTRTANETNALTDFPIMTDVTVEIPCVSNTWEVGDLVGPVEYTTGTYNGTNLETQKVTKVTDPALAIGRCTQRKANADTKVQCRLISRVLPHDALGGDPEATFEWGFPIYPGAGTTRTLLTAREAFTVTGIDVEIDVAQNVTATVVKAAVNAAPASNTTPLHNANGINMNTAANTTQAATLTATAADLVFKPTDKIAVVFNAALNTGQGLVTVRAKRA